MTGSANWLASLIAIGWLGLAWNAIKSRLLDMLDSKGPLTIAAGKNSYQLPPIDAGDWRRAIEDCKN